MKASDYRIEIAEFPIDAQAICELLIAYRDESQADVCFASFEAELKELAATYRLPEGEYLVARSANALLGCIAWRRLAAQVCELRRLYVTPECRRLGLGRDLVLQLLARVETLGFEQVRLHTLPSMESAIRLYKSLSFHPVKPESASSLEPLYFERRTRIA